MKDGRILHQGTLEDIQDQNPELVANWRATIKTIVDSESEMSDAAVDVTEERAKLARQVSKQLEETKRLQDKGGWVL